MYVLSMYVQYDVSAAVYIPELMAQSVAGISLSLVSLVW